MKRRLPLLTPVTHIRMLLLSMCSRKPISNRSIGQCRTCLQQIANSYIAYSRRMAQVAKVNGGNGANHSNDDGEDSPTTLRMKTK